MGKDVAGYEMVGHACRSDIRPRHWNGYRPNLHDLCTFDSVAFEDNLHIDLVRA